MAKKSLTGAAAVLDTATTATAGENLTSTKTSERPRPEVVIYTEPVTFEPLNGTKWDGRANGKLVNCADIADDELIGFKVGYVYDIPQHKVKVNFVEVMREVAEDGQRFRGSKTFYKVVATFADGTVRTTTDTADNIRRKLGIGVSGAAKTTAEQLHLWFSGKGAELNSKLKHAEFNAKFTELAELVAKFVEAERAKREADRAKASAEAKAQKETDKTVETLRKQGVPEEVIQMYLASRK